MTTTTWYCDNLNILHGIRLRILFAEEAPTNVTQVLKSDNQLFNYMLIFNDPPGRDEKISEYLSNEGVNCKRA